MAITLRCAETSDFDYCSRLYFVGNAQIIRDLGLDMATQIASFHEQWQVTEVRIIQHEGSDAGWFQTRLQEDAVFLAQIFMDSQLQGRGIGTEVLKRVIDDAARAGRDVTLGVVKSNPARHLYERLGFRMTNEDERKYYMRWSLHRSDPR